MRTAKRARAERSAMLEFRLRLTALWARDLGRREVRRFERKVLDAFLYPALAKAKA